MAIFIILYILFAIVEGSKIFNNFSKKNIKKKKKNCIQVHLSLNAQHSH